LQLITARPRLVVVNTIKRAIFSDKYIANYSKYLEEDKTEMSSERVEKLNKNMYKPKKKQFKGVNEAKNG
jgi:hypothetical protein